jgi:CelD/BcsL family acetyltransferase involved in cellulose biosynthesis
MGTTPERCEADAVFMSQAWLGTWWECFGSGKHLHVIVVYAGGELVGAAPMMITTSRPYGFKVRRLESIYNFHTPRFDFLIADRHEEVYRAIWNEIRRSEEHWDMAVLCQIPASSPTISIVEGFASEAGWLSGRWSPPPSPYIELSCSFDEFFNRIKGKERYNLRKRQSRLSEMGRLQLEVITESVEVREVIQDGLRIEAAAWKGRNGTAINSDPQVEEFYTRFAERAADMGWLRLCFLRVGDKRIAFDYAIEQNGKLYGVKIGYDPEYHTCSPGHVLLLLLLQEACNRECTEYDFLGVDDEWKYSFTREVRPHNWLFLYPNSLRAKLLHSMKFSLIPWAKKLCTFRHGRA